MEINLSHRKTSWSKRINLPDNNRVLIEKTLEKAIREIFIRLKMGLADWDIDAILRDALEGPIHLERIQDIVKKYDETFDSAMKSKIQIQDKYKNLYMLRSKNTDK